MTGSESIGAPRSEAGDLSEQTPPASEKDEKSAQVLPQASESAPEPAHASGAPAVTPSPAPAKKPSPGPTANPNPGKPSAAKPNPAKANPATKAGASGKKSVDKAKLAQTVATPSKTSAAGESQGVDLGVPAPFVPSAGAQAAREARKARARRFLWGLAVWVGVPTLLALIYYSYLVQPCYESVSSFAVRGAEPAKRAALLQEYVRSRDMLAELERHKKFSQHFQNSSDPIARLSAKAGSESRYAYYRDHVLTDLEASTGIITLRVRAFSGGFAAEVAEHLVAEAANMLIAMDQQQSEKMLASAERDLGQAQAKLLAFQAPQGDAGGEARSSHEVELVRHEVQAALEDLRAVRATVRSQQDPLVVIARPSRPDEATHPRRARGVLSVFLVALSLFGIGSLLVSSVREHAHL